MLSIGYYYDYGLFKWNIFRDVVGAAGYDGSEEGKRMISNRESARRSRMRKQKHLDDLASQLTQLRSQNQQLLTSVNLTSHKYLAVEAENSVLRAQVNELSHRLDSLNQIIHLLNFFEPDASTSTFFNNPFNFSLPIMASADMLQY